MAKGIIFPAVISVAQALSVIIGGIFTRAAIFPLPPPRPLLFIMAEAATLDRD